MTGCSVLGVSWVSFCSPFIVAREKETEGGGRRPSAGKHAVRSDLEGKGSEARKATGATLISLYDLYLLLTERPNQRALF